MPKKGQNRKLPTELRDVLAENLEALMDRNGWNDGKVGAESGVGRNTVARVRKRTVAANLDTVQALAAAFGVQPPVLLMLGGVRQLAAVFATPVPDTKLGNGWTRPDRKPLLQSDTAKSSSRNHKIKSRS
jgi:hypothetical protein